VGNISTEEWLVFLTQIKARQGTMRLLALLGSMERVMGGRGSGVEVAASRIQGAVKAKSVRVAVQDVRIEDKMRMKNVMAWFVGMCYSLIP